MIKFENHLGTIDISYDYFVSLVGETVVNCFGVAAMSPVTARQSLYERLIRKEESRIDRGIRIRTKNQKLVIDLHIIVTFGTNISAIVKSIMHKVRFTMEEKTGFEVARVNVFVDGMRPE